MGIVASLCTRRRNHKKYEPCVLLANDWEEESDSDEFIDLKRMVDRWYDEHKRNSKSFAWQN